MRTRLLALLCFLLPCLLTACGGPDDARHDAHTGQPPSSSLLQAREWGVNDGMISVVVDNPTGHLLQHADASLVAKDDQGATIWTSAVKPGARCCTVLDLPPGQGYGLYFDAGAKAARVASVEVRITNVSYSPQTQPFPSPERFEAHPVSVRRTPRNTIVRALVSTRGDETVPQATVQAFLRGPDGKFLAVISGVWTCFVPGDRTIHMQLYHPVPRGTQVSKVLVRPLADSQDQPAPHCS